MLYIEEYKNGPVDTQTQKIIDAVIKDKSWRLREVYIWFYLFPS